MKKIFLFAFLFIGNFCNAQKKDSAWRILPIEKDIRINIIGEWKDQNSTTTFFQNGSYSTEWNNGSKEIGSWKLKSKQLFFSANGVSVDDVYNIIYFSGTTMKTQLANGSDSTIWVATKIKK